MSVLRKSTWIAWAENIALVLIISFAFYTTQPIQTTRTLLVPQGSITYIISQLTQEGYALSPIDKYILAFLGKPQSGWVDIGATELNRIDFLYRLTTAKAKMEEVTLIPGETREIFFTALANDLKLDKTKLDIHYESLSKYPEAGIYADTYYVPYGIHEKHLIHFLLSESEKKCFIIFSSQIDTPLLWITDEHNYAFIEINPISKEVLKIHDQKYSFYYITITMIFTG